MFGLPVTLHIVNVINNVENDVRLSGLCKNDYVPPQ